ncbi:unnamed protein product [Miscanthus lutarioriparius]|uniref:Uncharacterized protein n=1 Tax=Miscanthus lutarioriparius TaxID=422564 RepID=A0A811P930_9POAL|nr:unnamed protein product [Miscanthus lutarioriparius]
MVAALEGFGSKPTTEEARLTDFVMGKKEVPEEKRDIGERRESWESPSGGVRYFIFFKRAVDDTVDSEEVAGQSGAQSSFCSSASVEWSPKPTPRTMLPLPPPPPRVEKPMAKPAAVEPTTTSSAPGALAAVKAYRRALGLCYKCNAKWSKDHRCAPELLHAIEALWGSLDPDVVPAAETSNDPPTEQVFLAISKSAVSGVSAARTIRLLGSTSGIPVHILVDSGSSSSFISNTTTVKLHHLDSVSISSCVQLASGGVLQSSLLLRQV